MGPWEAFTLNGEQNTLKSLSSSTKIWTRCSNSLNSPLILTLNRIMSAAEQHHHSSCISHNDSFNMNASEKAVRHLDQKKLSVWTSTSIMLSIFNDLQHNASWCKIQWKSRNPALQWLSVLSVWILSHLLLQSCLQLCFLSGWYLKKPDAFSGNTISAAFSTSSQTQPH